MCAGRRNECRRHIGPPCTGHGIEAATRVLSAATRFAWARATSAGPGHAATGSACVEPLWHCRRTAERLRAELVFIKLARYISLF